MEDTSTAVSIVLTLLDSPNPHLLRALPRVIDALQSLTSCTVSICPARPPIPSLVEPDVLVCVQPGQDRLKVFSSSFFPWLRYLLCQLTPSTSADQSAVAPVSLLRVPPFFISLIGVLSHTDLIPDADAQYALGHADSRGRVGVISTLRLVQSLSGNEMTSDQPSDAFIFALTKLLLHEIGHTVGLKHCSLPPSKCRMAPATVPTDLTHPTITQLSFCYDCESLFRQRKTSFLLEYQRNSMPHPS